MYLAASAKKPSLVDLLICIVVFLLIICTLLYFELRAVIFVLLSIIRLCFFQGTVPENFAKPGLLFANFLHVLLMFLETINILSFQWKNDPYDYVGCIKHAHTVSVSWATRFKLIHDSFVVDNSPNMCFKVIVAYRDSELFTKKYVHSPQEFSLAKCYVDDRFAFVRGTETIKIISQDIEIFDKGYIRYRHIRICLSKLSLRTACAVLPSGTMQSAWNNAVMLANVAKNVTLSPTQHLKNVFGVWWMLRWFLVCAIFTVFALCINSTNVLNRTRNVFQRITDELIGLCMVVYLLWVLAFENFWLEFACSCIVPSVYFGICWMMSDDNTYSFPNGFHFEQTHIPRMDVMYYPEIDPPPQTSVVADPLQRPVQALPMVVADPPQRRVADPPRRRVQAQPVVVADPPQRRVQAQPVVVADPPQRLVEAQPVVIADPPQRRANKRKANSDLQHLGPKRQTRTGRLIG
jgi:hypothetical protein